MSCFKIFHYCKPITDTLPGLADNLSQTEVLHFSKKYTQEIKTFKMMTNSVYNFPYVQKYSNNTHKKPIIFNEKTNSNFLASLHIPKTDKNGFHVNSRSTEIEKLFFFIL